VDPRHFDCLDATIDSRGARETLQELIETFEREGLLPQLFEALLMRKRHELHLPLEGTDSIKDIPVEHQEDVEDYYVEVCRKVGGLFLERGDIAGAWPYFRAIDEPESVADAIDAWEPPEEITYDDDGSNDLDAIVDIAFNQGANPRRGYELILSQYGTCRAVTTIEHQFPHKGAIREACAKMLIDQLWGELHSGIRSDIEHHGSSHDPDPDPGSTHDPAREPPDGATVTELIADRKWLFDSMGYHVDVSHLQACIRVAATVEDRGSIARAVEMCDYGRQLSRDFHSEERPPFDDFYNDYRIYLRALLDEGVDGAARYFRSKAERYSGDPDHGLFCAEVLVSLLHRVGRGGEAIESFLVLLGDSEQPLTLAPSLLRLCEGVGDFTALLDTSRQKGDLLHYTLGLVKRSELDAGTQPAASAEPETPVESPAAETETERETDTGEADGAEAES